MDPFSESKNIRECIGGSTRRTPGEYLVAAGLNPSDLANRDILNVGSGHTKIQPFCEKRGIIPASIAAIDINPQTNTHQTGETVILGDATNLDGIEAIQGRSYDIAFCLYLWGTQIVSDEGNARVLAGIYNHLKQGGRAYIFPGFEPENFTYATEYINTLLTSQGVKDAGITFIHPKIEDQSLIDPLTNKSQIEHMIKEDTHTLVIYKPTSS